MSLPDPTRFRKFRNGGLLYGYDVNVWYPPIGPGILQSGGPRLWFRNTGKVSKPLILILWPFRSAKDVSNGIDPSTVNSMWVKIWKREQGDLTAQDKIEEIFSQPIYTDRCILSEVDIPPNGLFMIQTSHGYNSTGLMFSSDPIFGKWALKLVCDLNIWRMYKDVALPTWGFVNGQKVRT